MLILDHYQISNLRQLGSLVKTISLLILCSAWLALAACGANQDEKEAQVEEEPTTPEIKVEKASSIDVVAEVQANKEKWLAHGIKAYEIEMQKICYCAPDAVRLMLFQVTDNEIKDVRYADSGDAVDPSHYNNLNTIEGMFTLVEQALKENPADLIISYDAEYGYIKELTVDYQENIADDEFTFIASNMRPSK